MIVEEIKNIKSRKKDLRKFGITVGLVFTLLGALLLWRQKAYYYWLFIAAATFLVPGLLVPVLLRPLHKVWMTVAIVLGWIMTRIILTVLFYLVITPIGLLGRLFGKSFLDLKFDNNAESYWIPRKKAEFVKEAYEKQF